MEKEKIAEFIAAAKAKGIPEKYAKRYHIGEGFEAEAALTELQTEWTEMKQIALGLPVESIEDDRKIKAIKAIKEFTTQQNKAANEATNNLTDTNINYLRGQ